ncbi:MAG TPA: hypothetical protein DCL80_13080 [Balneola sp.]|jgi:antitoxin component YwqK of YwqJK toxin-antitoxin module|nr:hypothetical protein [Balneola sp.]MAO76403.1 hypothetical protein [Balneola sp.]MBF65594.1 hypothetical protein [Balneola sp.]HAH52126.1 hypothetical protein [Balneola sp.]HBZ39847.1 hypothetical protein [Balneola sp.]|tara:strand:+ start:570 stop:2414 length:1845 start_codon:yes stop_codon:yes gene_type:complete
MIAYLIKSGLCLVILLGIYLLFLERQKMHRFNRFFLLFSLVFALSIPFYTIDTGNVRLFTQQPAEAIETISVATSDFVERNLEPKPIVDKRVESAPVSAETSDTDVYKPKKQENLTRSNSDLRIPLEQPVSTSETDVAKEYKLDRVYSLSVKDVAIGLYGSVTLVLLTKLLLGLVTFYRKRALNKHAVYGTANVVLIPEPTVPHTFLNTIYVYKEDYEKGRLSKQILDHELTHAKQKHSLDVLFIELLRVVFWFNPIFYLYKRAIQINHEFLADDSVISKTKDTVSYQKLLISSIFPSYKTSLASSFNYSLTKKRFNMMMKEYSFLSVATKKIVMIPILLSVALIFCTDNTTQKTTRINGVEYWYGFLSNDTYSKVKILTKVQERDSITNSNIWTFYDGNGNPFSGSNTIYLKENDKVYSISKFENGRLLSRVLFSDKDEEVFRTENEFRNGLLFTTSTSLRDTLYQKSTYPPFTKNNSRIFQRFYPNGNLQFEYGTKQEAERQFYHGLLTLYGEDGDIIEQELYENGERVPITREFLEERYLELRTRYKKTLAEYLNMEVSMSSMEELNIAYWELKTAQARRFALEKKLDTTGVTPPPPPIPPNPEQRLKNAN